MGGESLTIQIQVQVNQWSWSLDDLLQQDIRKLSPKENKWLASGHITGSKQGQCYNSNKAALRNYSFWSFLVPQWLKTQCFHCCGSGSIPPPGTSACHRHGKEKKKITHFLTSNNKLTFSSYSQPSPSTKINALTSLLNFQMVHLPAD